LAGGFRKKFITQVLVTDGGGSGRDTPTAESNGWWDRRREGGSREGGRRKRRQKISCSAFDLFAKSGVPGSVTRKHGEKKEEKTQLRAALRFLEHALKEGSPVGSASGRIS